MNPYETLGVDRDASAEEVRRAYKRKAKATHPEAGGSAEEFDEVSRAHLVLTDPARRAKFDRTGDTAEEPGVDAQAAGLLQGLVSGIMDAPDDLLSEDLVALMRKKVRSSRNEISTQIAALRRKVERGEKIAGRFQRAAGDNLLRRGIERQIDGMRDQVAAGERQLEVAKAALAMLDTYSYDRPERPAESSFSFFATAVNATSSSSTAARW